MSDFETIYRIEKHDEHNNAIVSYPPLIPMKLEMPVLEKQIAEKGMHPSKSPKKKHKKVSEKPNTAAVESV